MKFEHTQVFNFEGAFRGLRNPLESWSKSDSCYCNPMKDCSTCTAEGYCEDHCYPQTDYIIGKNDMNIYLRISVWHYRSSLRDFILFDIGFY